MTDKHYIYKKKAFMILAFFLILSTFLFSQNQQRIDSLEQVYIKGTYKEEEKLDILKELSFNHNDPEKALLYSEDLILNAQQLDATRQLFFGYFYKGNALTRKGNLSEALKSYFKGAEIAGKEKTEDNLGTISISIGDVYSIMGNHNNAVYYYKKAIAIHKKNDNPKELATVLNNLGDEYLLVSKPDSALLMFEESGPIAKRLGFTEGIAMNIGNKGIAYAMLGKDDLAKDEINQAINMFEKMEKYYPITIFLMYMSDLYLNQGYWDAALGYAQRSLELAVKYGLKDEISKANLQLSKLYEQSGDAEASLRYFKDHIAYKDSVSNISAVQQMANIRTDFEISQKQLEVDLLNQQKKNQRIVVIATIIALILIIGLAIGLFRRNKFIEKTKKLVEIEKYRSDQLLLNILPEQTAQELKEFGKVHAKKFESVSVLFTDFKGFTKLSENLSPENLVKSVDFYYQKFDAIIKSHGLEKIKTIGDAYMAAGGLPFPSKDHAVKLVTAALEIADFVEKVKASALDDDIRFDIRIGVHSGPVVAGVVGTDKFAYDIWGDTVNIASRMESTSLPGKVNISDSTYELIKDEFECEYRGEIQAKNKGKLKMYFVMGPKSRKKNSPLKSEKTTSSVNYEI